MNISDILTVAAAAGAARGRASSSDASVALWMTQVNTNGGGVSAAKAAAVTTLVDALEAAGSWALIDDLWLLVSENEAQALTSLKQRRLATAVLTPTFTADQGYVFNGTSQYLDTGFIPSTHAVAMTGSELMMGVYERTNVLQNREAMGSRTSGSNTFHLRPRSTGDVIQVALNIAALGVGVITDSRGLTVIQRSGAVAPTVRAYKNGASAASGVQVSTSTSLVNISTYIGAYNNSGAAALWRASTLGLAMVGAPMSAGQHADTYTAIQAYMTSSNGANV